MQVSVGYEENDKTFFFKYTAFLLIRKRDRDHRVLTKMTVNESSYHIYHFWAFLRRSRSRFRIKRKTVYFLKKLFVIFFIFFIAHRQFMDLRATQRWRIIYFIIISQQIIHKKPYIWFKISKTIDSVILVKSRWKMGHYLDTNFPNFFFLNVKAIHSVD